MLNWYFVLKRVSCFWWFTMRCSKNDSVEWMYKKVWWNFSFFLFDMSLTYNLLKSHAILCRRGLASRDCFVLALLIIWTFKANSFPKNSFANFWILLAQQSFTLDISRVQISLTFLWFFLIFGLYLTNFQHCLEIPSTKSIKMTFFNLWKIFCRIINQHYG